MLHTINYEVCRKKAKRGQQRTRHDIRGYPIKRACKSESQETNRLILSHKIRNYRNVRMLEDKTKKKETISKQKTEL